MNWPLLNERTALGWMPSVFVSIRTIQSGLLQARQDWHELLNKPALISPLRQGRPLAGRPALR